MDAVTRFCAAAAGMSGGILEQIREGRGSTAPDRRGSTDPEHHARQIAFKLAVLSNPRLKATNPSSTLKSLTNLMVGSADNKARVVAGGGVEVMLAALAAFDSDRALVEAAVAALYNLMIGSADNKARVVAAGGVEGVLKALETFSDDARPHGVVYWAVSALSQVSQGGPAALARLRALGAAAHVRAAMAVPGVHERAQEYGQKILARLGC